MRLANIAEGWAKHVGLMDVPQNEKEVAIKRVTICIECPFSKEQWMNKFINDVLQKDIAGSGIGCRICGCPVNQKALVMAEKCPENKW